MCITLVLSRRIGETIVINDNIVVRIVDINGLRVRIGVEAPQEIRIERGELVTPPPEAEAG